MHNEEFQSVFPTLTTSPLRMDNTESSRQSSAIAPVVECLLEGPIIDNRVTSVGKGVSSIQCPIYATPAKSQNVTRINIGVMWINRLIGLIQLRSLIH